MVLYPFYLLKMRVTNNFETTRDYNTGQTSSILPVCARTTLYNNYFLTSTVRSWNNEPMATKIVGVLHLSSPIISQNV